MGTDKATAMHLGLTFLILFADSTVPPLHSIERFPLMTRQQWGEVCDFNLKQQAYLYKLINLYPLDSALTDAIQDLVYRKNAWELLNEARWSVYQNDLNVNYRRTQLRQLFFLLRPEAFNAGKMPHPLRGG